MNDLSILSVEDLVELRDAVTAELKSKRADVREASKVDRARLDSENRGKYEDESKIRFMFNKVETVGKLVRQSEKSVTVEFELDGETVKRYRKYADILGLAE